MEIQTVGTLTQNAAPAVTQPPAEPSRTLCPPESTLWMGDMNPSWTFDFIKAGFDKFNVTVKNVKFVTEKSTGRPASYCFVEFNCEDDARNALLSANGRHVPNDPERRRFHLSFANSPEPHLEFNLFVSNLHHSIDDVALFKVFGEKYKSCRGAKVHRSLDGSSKESGFIRFVSETDQQMALVEMNKQKLKGKEMVLKLAQPKARGGPNRGPRGGAPSRMNMTAGYPIAPLGFIPMQPYNPILGVPNQFMQAGNPGYGNYMSATAPSYRERTSSSHRKGRGLKRSRSRTPEKSRKPAKIFLESVDAPTADEHNEFLMANEWDWSCSFEQARFSKVLISSDLKTRDLAVELYEK